MRAKEASLLTIMIRDQYELLAERHVKVLSSKLEDAYMLRDQFELLAVRHVKVQGSEQ